MPRMTSSHAAASPEQAPATDGVHRVSVLLYSDDITTRDAVRAAVGRRPAADVEIVAWHECATAEAVVEAWTPAATTSSSWTARPSRWVAWACAGS